MSLLLQELAERVSTISEVNEKDKILFDKKYYLYFPTSKTSPDAYILSTISYIKGYKVFSRDDKFVFICDEEPTLPSITFTREGYMNGIADGEIVIGRE